MAIFGGAMPGVPQQAFQAAQMQQFMTDQQRMKVLSGVQNGSINADEFRALANNINNPEAGQVHGHHHHHHGPRDHGPMDGHHHGGLGAPGSTDRHQAHRAHGDIRAAREGTNSTTLPDGTVIRQPNVTTLPDGTRITGGNSNTSVLPDGTSIRTEGGSPPVPGMAFQAAQMQMFATDQKQAQTIYEQIAGRARSFNSMYDKYTHGDFHPQTQMNPQDAARLDQVYANLRGGQMNPQEALQLMR